MTHELKNLLLSSFKWKGKNLRSVMATVVALEGSSYRRPGVRMLISENGEMIGVVSGGCVEKEVVIQSESVFKTGIPKVMTYDGRYRLGCEGVLYILIEPLEITEDLINVTADCFENRQSFLSKSYFKSEFSESSTYGSILKIDGINYSLNPSFSIQNSEEIQIFEQQFKPIFQLYIFGAEHDAVQLCELANKVGWEVHIIASPDEQKTIDYFKGAKSLTSPLMQAIDVSKIGKHTAIMLMSHSLNKDLQYLMALKDSKPSYIGILGSSKRRERIFSELLNYFPDISLDFFDTIHSPAGLHIGAETPSEIALSIIAEILSVTRNVEVIPLREKTGKIHD